MLDIPIIVGGNCKFLADDSSHSSPNCVWGSSRVSDCLGGVVLNAVAVPSDAAAAISCSSADVCCCGSHLGMAMAELGSGLKSSL